MWNLFVPSDGRDIPKCAQRFCFGLFIWDVSTRQRPHESLSPVALSSAPHLITRCSPSRPDGHGARPTRMNKSKINATKKKKNDVAVSSRISKRRASSCVKMRTARGMRQSEIYIYFHWAVLCGKCAKEGVRRAVSKCFRCVINQPFAQLGCALARVKVQL